MFKSKYFLMIFIVSLLFALSCSKSNSDVVPVLPTISASSKEVNETDIDQTITIEVRLNEISSANVSVEFAIVDVSTSTNDYELVTKSPLIINAGSKSAMIDIKIKGDKIKENTEKFKLKFYNASNAKISPDDVLITIIDNDVEVIDPNAIVIPTEGFTSPNTYAGYSLTWADEFSGNTINEDFWTFEIGDGCPNNCGWGNNELEYYRKENASIKEGNLIITAKKENYGGKNYTSTRMITKGKKFFKYGRIDIRAALPKGQGIWPALWMLGENISTVGWPASGEIDIMECLGHETNRVHGTVHFGKDWTQHIYKGTDYQLTNGENFNDTYHVFSILWEENKIEFLVDDKKFFTVTDATVGSQPYPFNDHFFFIFNVAVGGNWPGSPNETTQFPQHMIVDYVRVFGK